MARELPPTEAAAAADFRGIEAWIFDLDNTLYPAHCDLFAQIDTKMTRYVADLLDVSDDDARIVQKAYYRDHGTTLNGLMQRHGVEPEDFLAFVHDIDLATLEPDAILHAGIARLPGRRVIFTNGCTNHAERVLAKLGLTDLFSEIWDIRATGYRPKPDRSGYDAMQAQLGGRRAAMFEDAARNLVPAHEVGWTTVWLKNGSVWSKQGPEHPVPGEEHIHHTIFDLPQFLHDIRI
ncbi:MAG: pyrimidine 5'-nucleotidase [Alphaproteobacteria bacterium]|nr:pyrimidine 5'-nucleotidase [Alphaproteobacteria bacterium]